MLGDSSPRSEAIAALLPDGGGRAPPLAPQVFDFANFAENLPDLAVLVIGCIEAKICKKICVGKLSPRSTQSTPLYRSLISKFWLEIAEGLVEVLKVRGRARPSSRTRSPHTLKLN